MSKGGKEQDFLWGGYEREKTMKWEQQYLYKQEFPLYTCWFHSSIELELEHPSNQLFYLVLFFQNNGHYSFLMGNCKLCVCGVYLDNEENNYFLLEGSKMWVIWVQETQLD